MPEILTTVRQHSEREREIVTHFRENRPERAIAMKREDGSAHMVMGGQPGDGGGGGSTLQGKTAGDRHRAACAHGHER